MSMYDQPKPNPDALKVTLRLSSREKEIVQLLASGLRVGEIATKLGLSVKTISTYRVRALQKLRMKTTAQLIQYWHERHPEMPQPTEAVESSALLALPDDGDAQESQ